MNFDIRPRLAELMLEPRWPMEPGPKIDLINRYFAQAELNSIGGLAEMLAELPPLALVAEVGCYWGVSTECLALFAEELLAVDPWPDEEVLKICTSRLSKYRNVIMFRAASPAAADKLPDASLDLVYIDAMHTYAEVCADIRAWLPKIRPGGWIAGHDFVDYQDAWIAEYIQVIPAVRDTLGEPDRVYRDSSWIKQV